MNQGVHTDLLRTLPKAPVIYDHNKCFTLCLANVRSLNTSSEELLVQLIENEVDLCVMTETWINNDNVRVAAIFKENGFNLINEQRVNRRGGGIGLLHKDNIKSSIIDKGEKSSFEYVVWNVEISKTEIFKILVVYRTPYSQAHPVTVSVFLEEFPELLGNLPAKLRDIMIMGDFNIDYHSNKYESRTYKDILETYGLQQHIPCATHESGSTIDHILTFPVCKYKIDVPSQYWKKIQITT